MSTMLNILGQNNNQKKYSTVVSSNKFQARKLQKNMMAISTQDDSNNHDEWYTVQKKTKDIQPGLNKKTTQQGKFAKLQSFKYQNEQKQNSVQNPLKQITITEQQNVKQELQLEDWQDIWNMLDKNNQNKQIEQKIQKKAQIIIKANENENCQLTQEELMQIFGQTINTDETIKKQQQQPQQQQQYQQQKNQIIFKKQNQKIIQQSKQSKQSKQQQVDNDLLQIWNQLEEQQKKQQSVKVKVQKDFKKMSQISQRQKQGLNNIVIFQNSNYSSFLQQQQQQKQKFSHSGLKEQDQIYTFSPVLRNQKISSQEQKSLSLLLVQEKNYKEKQKNTSSTSQSKKYIGQEQIANQIKRECYNNQMTKLIFSQDFVVHNYKQYCLALYKQKTYTYLGFKEFVNQKNQIETNKFFLYSFQTKENILMLEPETFNQNYAKDLIGFRKITLATGHEVVKKVVEYNTKICYKVSLCSTGERVATLFWKEIKDGLVFELKLFDQYEQKHAESIVIIEVKDGFVAQSCYCDTNVYIANQNAKKFKNQQLNFSYKPSIQKLKMILNIRNQKLTANMGINGIESSPYNCCLQNKHKKFVYLMGMFKDQDFGKYIVKIGQGISPLIGMAIAACRKIYIDSFNE